MNDLIYIYFAVINVFLFVLMGLDKRKAVSRKYRISESVLLALGAIGGGGGGLLAMIVFRHKTRKIKFYAVFIIAIAIYLYIFLLERDFIKWMIM